MQDDFALPQQSFVAFLYQSCGLFYGLLIPMVALAAFAMSLLLVVRGRDSLVGAALVLIVPLPLLVGLYASLDGLISSMMVIAMSSMAPTPSEWYAGFASSIVTTWLGLLLMAPALLTAILGLLVRALRPAA